MTELLRKFEITHGIQAKPLEGGYQIVRNFITDISGEVQHCSYGIVSSEFNLSSLKPYEDIKGARFLDIGAYDAYIYAFERSIFDVIKVNIHFDQIFKKAHQLNLEQLFETGWDSSKHVLLGINISCHRIVDLKGKSVGRWVRFDRENCYAIDEYHYKFKEVWEYLNSREDIYIEPWRFGGGKDFKFADIIPSYNWEDEDGKSAPRFFNFWIWLEAEQAEAVGRCGIPKSILDLSEFEVD